MNHVTPGRGRGPRLGVIAAVAAVGVAVAGCGSSSGSGTGSAGGGGGSYTIAFQGPLSGDNAQLGINAINGAKLAVQEANSSHALPYTLNLAPEDDQGDPAQAPAIANKVIGDPKIIAVVGPMFSGATKASEGIYTQANILSVSPSATRVDLTQDGFKTFFRVIAPDSAQGTEAAKYISKALHAKKVYAISDKSDYGQGVTDITVQSLKSDSVAVTADGVAAGTKDYSAEATKVKQSGADVVYYGGYYADASLLAKALRAAGFTGPIVSDDGTNDDKYIQLGGPASVNSFFTCGCADARVDPKDQAFFADYKKAYGADPGTYSPEAYDATNALISVLKGLGKHPTRAGIVSAFRSVDYQGLTKEVKFTSAGEVTTATIYLYAVKNGKRVLDGTVDSLTGG